MALFFAYGLLLDAALMRQVAPRHRRRGVARLAGWRFALTRLGLATIAPRPGGVVEGLVWEIGPRDEAALDRFEGVDRGIYRRRRLAVDGRTALVYVANDPPAAAAPARPDYAETVLQAAVAAGLSEAYLEEMRAVLAGRSQVHHSRSGGTP